MSDLSITVRYAQLIAAIQVRLVEAGVDDATALHRAQKIVLDTTIDDHTWERGFIDGWDKASADFHAQTGAWLREPGEVTAGRKLIYR